MKLPGFRLPFLKRADKGSNGARGAPQDPHDLVPEDRPRRWPVYAALVAYLLVFGGAGGLVGWLVADRETIEQDLRAERPSARSAMFGGAPVAQPGLLGPGDGQGGARGSEAARQFAESVGGGDGEDGPDPFAALLHPHPDPALVQAGEQGPLPVISADGRQAWRVYSRPFNVLDSRPKVAVVITRLGQNPDVIEAAIRLPGVVTLAFLPHTRKLEEWVKKARDAGHEVLINLPMEPLDFPRSDPGPYTLLTSLDQVENVRRLEWVLSRTTGYVGVTNFQGSRFASDSRAFRPIMSELKRRGLLFLDARSSVVSVTPQLIKSTGVAGETADKFIDTEASEMRILASLDDVGTIAKNTGSAIAVGEPYPVTIGTVRDWLKRINEQGLVAVPLTAVVATNRAS